MLLGSVLTFHSCKTKKDDVPTATVNPSNGKVVSDNIVVTNGATKKMGSLPAATGTSTSPVVESPKGSIPALVGRKFSFEPSLSSSKTSVRGIYFQIVGSSDYYDVPLKLKRVAKTKGNRINADTASSVQIQLPANITTGTFCIDYCVYDDIAQVSNTVRVCVTVNQIGGTGSDFLMGKWKFVSYTYDSSVVDVTNDKYSFYDYTSCYNDSTAFTYWCGPNATDSCTYYSRNYKSDSIYVTYNSTDNCYFTFTDNGGMREDDAYTTTFAPYTFPVCGTGPTYQPQNYVDVANGGWSYTESTQKLIMLFDESDYGYVDPYALELSITSLNGTTMILYDPIDGTTYTFEKQP